MTEQRVQRLVETGLKLVARTRTLSSCPSRVQPTCPMSASAAGASRCVFMQTTEPDTLSGVPHSAAIEEKPTAGARPFDEMPGPKGYPVVGTLLEYFRPENRGRMHEIQRRNHRIYGSIFREPFGPAQNVCVADPTLVAEILRSEGPYPNRPPYQSWVLYNTLRKLRGGIMTAQGEYWKASRRSLSSKLMKPGSVADYLGDVNAITAEFVERVRLLRSQRQDGASVGQLPFEINKYTMEVVGQVLLNVRIGTLQPVVSPKIQDFISAIGRMFLTGHQLMAFARLHQLLGTRAWREHVQAWDTIYDLGCELMEGQIDRAFRRLQDAPLDDSQSLDLITYLAASGSLTRDEIVNNLIETFMGGVDTVANGVAFIIYLLSRNHAAQTKLRNQVDTVLGKRACTMDDLQALPYVKAVVKETMRLFPPIPINARVTQEDTVISNYHIPKGTCLMLNNYTMSRDPRIFTDPDSFNPDRWLRDEVATWHPFSSIPFGYGPRSCLGRRVAECIMHLSTIQMVQNFILEKDLSYDVTPLVRTQLTPGPELPVLFLDRR